MADESPGAMVAKSVIDNSIEEVTRNKEKIPSENLFDILRNEQYMKDLRPLIADAVLKASSIDGLMDDITKLFENKADAKLTEALRTLHNNLQTIYKNKQTVRGGRKRRRTNKRKNYKKRRSAKHR